MDWFIAFLIIAPAAFLYLQRSTWLIDYLVWVTVLNRGIRRVVDWQAGAFNVFSPISLTPLVVAGFSFLIVAQSYPQFPAFFQRILRLLSIALVFGLFMGLLHNGLSAIYSLAEYVGPLSIMGFAILQKGNERILDRWIKTVGWSAMFLSAYGWYQYFTIPAWDAFWVRAVGFEGYLGQLQPTQMTVFSTMSDRGPLAGFLALAVVPMLVSKRWRNLGSWGSVVLIISCILLTYVRTALITIALASVLYPVLNRGKNTVQIVLLLCFFALVGSMGLSHIPGSERISNRLATLQTLTSDGSFVGRIDIMKYGLVTSLKNPLGTGLGSAGLGGRINTGGISTDGIVSDDGYVEILVTFGWIGAGCFFYSFWLLWKQLRLLERFGIRSSSSMMFKSLLVSGAVTLLVANWLSSTGAMVFYLFAGFAIYPLPAMRRLQAARRARRQAWLAETASDQPSPSAA